MKSFIAALRTLTLPFGQTTGRRIVLDGVEGEIRFYGADDLLRLLLGGFDGDSIFLSTGDADEEQFARLFTNLGSVGQAHEWPILWIESPQLTGRDGTSIQLEGEAKDGSEPPILTLDIGFGDGTLTIFGDISVLSGARSFFGALSVLDVIIEEGTISIGNDVVPRVNNQAENATFPKFQYGTTVVSVSAGATTFTTAVTFDEEYDAAPIVLTGFNSNSGSRPVEVEARSITTTGFTACVRSSDNVNFGGGANYNIGWCAIGEISP